MCAQISMYKCGHSLLSMVYLVFVTCLCSYIILSGLFCVIFLFLSPKWKDLWYERYSVCWEIDIILNDVAVSPRPQQIRFNNGSVRKSPGSVMVSALSRASRFPIYLRMDCFKKEDRCPAGLWVDWIPNGYLASSIGGVRGSLGVVFATLRYLCTVIV